MTGINSLLFLKVLCDLERQKIETVPDEEFIQEACASNEQLCGKTNIPCVIKIYMQEKHGEGGSVGSKRYVCPRCSCLFRHKHHLREHLRFHCTHKCLGCSECFARIHSSFKRFGEENIEPAKTFSCSSCPMSFQTQAGLAIHQECHTHSDKVVDSGSCPQQSDRLRKSSSTSVVHACKKCGKTFSTGSNLGRHVRKQHRKSIDRYGNHFLAQLGADPEILVGHSEKPEEEEEYNDDSDAEEFMEASSKVCGLCNQNFKYAPLNKTHVCSRFPLPESLSEERFQQSSFQCPACSQIYSSFLALKLHCETHTGADPLTCTLCDRKYSSLRRVNLHFELHGRNTCNQCGVFFNKQLSLLLHFCEYTQRCFICNTIFPMQSGYKNHLLVHPKPQDFTYKCTECKKSFLKESYFRAHQIDHTGKQPFPCSVCNEKFLMYGPFKKHVMTHIISKRLKCQYCDDTFRSVKQLKAHSMSHSVKTESFLCEDCPQRFKTEAALEAHQPNCKVKAVEKAVVPALSGFQCDDCSKVFRKQHQLYLHLRDTHNKMPSYLFYCDLCSRGFYHRLHLDSHKRTCSQRDDEKRKQVVEKREQVIRKTFSKRQFQCSVCDKKYFTQQRLDNHLYVHRDPSECPYQCALCGIGYAQEYYLKKHLDKCKEDPKKAKHSIKCKVCGAMFLNEKTLNRHSKAHASEWECSLCKEKFITKRGYAKHMTLCTPERAAYKTFRKPSKPPQIYTCPTCERTFQLKDRFEAHVASHQGIIRYQCPTCYTRFMSINNFKRHKCKFKLKLEPVEYENCIPSPE